MPTLTLITFPEPSEPAVDAAEAEVRARYVADYLADVRRGDVIAKDWTLYEIEMYDAANPDLPPLMDEIRGLHLPAAA
ncbi:hypothetical protein [Streptomyces sp. JB150]|jgi:hypothetical protein|uniref:hypothetical protein n=1 Tax=Streptomyces sp. JB150 TaxID=2714844 RepID=UPI0014073F5B|nr:hypothetical protein [Streptomyces sp. JB150]QIJ61426.1 hypothetical protein G7Z13_04790 [Streptomyces sp. JB150]